MNLSPVYHGSIAADIQAALSVKQYSSIYLLADTNTEKYCIPLLPDPLKQEARLIVIPDGEAGKSLQSCELIWNHLQEHEADRNALLINIGGGVVCDAGSFAASTFKRGISYINIPTSLLAMVDAAIGGKTAINFNSIKNLIGTFQMPDAVILNAAFLDTLPERELRSGYAEMLKYGLIADIDLWKELVAINPLEVKKKVSAILRCIEIKNAIVSEDPHEKGRRKLLNFGHTSGHAFESFSHAAGSPLSHGEAVAAGMLISAYLSHKINKMSRADLDEIESVIMRYYPPYRIKEKDYFTFLQYMRQDKKNAQGNFRFVLLDWIGKAIYDVPCSEQEVTRAFDHYRNL